MKIDFIVPVYNEGAGIQEFHRSLLEALRPLSHTFRFLYVNDGSTDTTGEALAILAYKDSRVQPITLSRNFGHQAALNAGIDAADGDAVIMMDGDGEHPVDLVGEMIRQHESGYDVVQTQRLDRGRKGFLFKRTTAALFYYLINHLSETRVVDGAADFRLMSRDAVRALRQLDEYHRFYRGMVQWIGFRTVILPYRPGARLAGASKYSFHSMLRLAADGMFSFSLAPLRLALVMGLLFLLMAGAEFVFVLSFWVRGAQASLVPGWSSIILMLTISSGMSMILQGVLGIYVGMIFQEVKHRPVYIIRSDSPADVRTRLETSATEERSLQ